MTKLESTTNVTPGTPSPRFFKGQLLSYEALLVGSVCYCLPILQRHSLSTADWVRLALGMLAFIFAEFGNNLAKDYYTYRHMGAQNGKLLADWIKPELLVLKASWASYLVALLFVLLVAQSVGLVGWKLVMMSFVGFLSGYFAKADPLFWDRRWWGRCISALSNTFVPFIFSSILLSTTLNYLNMMLIIISFVIVVLRKTFEMFGYRKRYTKINFPPYAYRPGVSPHPTRDSAGHSYGMTEPSNSRTQPEFWRKTESYLYGVDLFNAGYYWEAHEAWESLWKNLDPSSDHALFLQGLIQVAASCLKYHLKNKEGVIRLSQQAIEKLMKIQKTYPEPYMGVDLKRFLPQVIRAFAPLQYLKGQQAFPKFRTLQIVLQ